MKSRIYVFTFLVLFLSLLLVACSGSGATPTLPPIEEGTPDAGSTEAAPTLENQPSVTPEQAITTVIPSPAVTVTIPTATVPSGNPGSPVPTQPVTGVVTATVVASKTVVPTTVPGVKTPAKPAATTAPGNPTATRTTSPGQTAVPTQTSAPTAIPTAPVAGSPVIGLEVNSLTTDGGLNQVRVSRAYWLRYNGLVWPTVEPTEGARNWATSFDDGLRAAVNQGSQIILVVRGTPDWAQKYPGIACGPVKTEKLTAFASFMHDAVAKYSIPPYNVLYWELGNEIDVEHTAVSPDSPFGCWGESSDSYFGGWAYAEMLKAVYPQMKSANSQVKVMVGGLLLDCDPDNPPETTPGSGTRKDCTPSRFLEGVLKNNGADYFDGVGFHAYDYYPAQLGQYANLNWNSSWDKTGPVVIAKARFLRSVLARFNRTDKFLINSESALVCGTTGSEEICQRQEYQNTKAYYLAQIFGSAMAEKLIGNIWYSMMGWRGSGLLDSSFGALPAYKAMQVSADQLNGAAFVSEITQFSGVKGYEFTRNGNRIWLLWSLDGNDHTLTLTDKPASAYDYQGNSLDSSKRQVISLSPVYLNFSP